MFYVIGICLVVGLIAFLLLLWFFLSPSIPTISVLLTPIEKSEELFVSNERFGEMNIRDAAHPGVVRCFDPATGCLLGSVQAMTERDVYLCVERSRVAQKQWVSTTWEQRRRVLQILLKYIIENQNDICRVDARDSGKPLVDAVLGEIITTCEKISYVLQHGESDLRREYRPVSWRTIYKYAFVEYHPLGVIGVIAPWNYPFHNLYNHIISGIFAGNGIVVKVSEYTSWSSGYFLRIVHEALRVEGHNPDLVQVITGFGDAGAALVSCPGVDQIVFTGSPQVGKLVMAGAAKSLKPVVLELGGKDPMVLCDDADVDTCLPIALRGTYQNSGQNCCGIERVIVHQKIYDEFVDKVVSKVRAFRQGPALGKDAIDVAAMVTPMQLDIIQSLIDDAVGKGARLLVGGKRNPNYPDGLFYEPTVLADVTSQMRIAQEEVFGPVMAIFRVCNDEEALHVVNECSFGLGSCVFCRSDARGEKFGQQMRCGMTCVNDFATNYLVQSLPFGGVKDSGFGRFGGREGLRSLCLQKSVVIDRFPFIRTTIPSVMQFPISNIALNFGYSLVGVLYGPTFKHRLRSIWKLIRGTQ
jgi:acyl-CoA reductase-like NAD-dependent aldehyde dehydrogenase